MADEVSTIVIDNGSGMIKTGFGGDEAPRSVFPSISGHRKIPLEKIFGRPYKDVYIGDEACAKWENLILGYPMEQGVVTNWDDMEKIWHHTFYEELRVDPSEHPVILTEPVKNPRFNRENMVQIMFETFNVPSLHVKNQNILSSYGAGLTTCIVLDIGDTVSSALPMYEGWPLPHAIKRINHAGRDVTSFMQDLINERGYMFLTSDDLDIVRTMKECHSYVAFDYDAELKKARGTSECDVEYTLPDGKIITISNERFSCAELLFNPLMNGFECEGIDKIIFESINKCDIDVRKELFASILITGGTSMIEGMTERIEKEITKLAPENTKIKVIAPPERKYLAWMGGSIFSCLATFPKSLVTHDEYKDEGPEIVNRKFC